MLDCPLHDLELVRGDGLHTFDRKLVNLGERVEVLALARHCRERPPRLSDGHQQPTGSVLWRARAGRDITENDGEHSYASPALRTTCYCGLLVFDAGPSGTASAASKRLQNSVNSSAPISEIAQYVIAPSDHCARRSPRRTLAATDLVSSMSCQMKSVMTCLR